MTIQVVNFIEFLKLSYVDGEAPESVTIKSKKDLKEKLQKGMKDLENIAGSMPILDEKLTGENTSNEWCEKVTDEEYNKLPE